MRLALFGNQDHIKTLPQKENQRPISLMNRDVKSLIKH